MQVFFLDACRLFCRENSLKVNIHWYRSPGGCSEKVISAIALAALLKACIVASRAPSCAGNGTECKASIFNMAQAYNERIYLSIAFPLFSRASQKLLNVFPTPPQRKERAWRGGSPPRHALSFLCCRRRRLVLAEPFEKPLNY